MNPPERALDRRPVVLMRLSPRVRRSEKLWRRILLYYVRHAERVWHRPDLRSNVQRELRLAKAEITACLGALGDDPTSGYLEEPSVACLDLQARFSEIIQYVELFEIADRTYWALQRVDLSERLGRGEARRIRSQVSHALRKPAQVVADTPALRAPLGPEQLGSLAVIYDSTSMT